MMAAVPSNLKLYWRYDHGFTFTYDGAFYETFAWIRVDGAWKPISFIHHACRRLTDAENAVKREIRIACTPFEDLDSTDQAYVVESGRSEPDGILAAKVA